MIRKITSKQPFKILGFTDTHLDDYQGCYHMTLKLLKETIKTEAPDMINDSRVLYKGIHLIYNRMSGLSSYNIISKKKGDKLLQGCSVYYIDSEGQLTFDDIFYEDRYPQYRDQIYAVIRK